MWHNSLVILGSLVCVGLAKELDFIPIVNITDTDYFISFDDKRINSVLFYTEMNNICPGKYVFAFNSNLSHPWVMQDHLNTSLNENKLRLHALLDVSGQIYSQSFNITMNPESVKSTTISNVAQIKKNLSPICAKLMQRVKKPEKHCIPTETITKNPVQCSGEKIFDSNFSNAIDKRIWSLHSCIPIDSVINYTNNTANAYIKDKHLHLKVTRAENRTKVGTLYKCHPKNLPKIQKGKFASYMYNRGYDSVKMDTNNTFSFKYGSIDIEAQMPIGNWIVPIIQLTAKHDHEVYILLAFIRGNMKLRSTENSEIGGTTLYGGVRNYWNKITVEKTSSQHYGSQLNNYTVIWHPDRIIYKVNGKSYGTITDEALLSKLQKDECIITLGINVGANEDFPYQTIHRNYKNIGNEYVNFHDHSASTSFRQLKLNWPQPEFIVKSVKIFSTHYLEE